MCFILIIYNYMLMTVSIIFPFYANEFFSLLFSEYKIWDRAPILYLFSLVSTYTFNALIYPYLDQRSALQRIYSVVRSLSLK